jgi:predicted RecA/RadA family phage recombinase
MATATYIQEGDAIDYTPTADLKAGGVIVQNELIGVAKRALPANRLGSLSVAGVFDFPKATGTDTAIDAGLDVFWDEAQRLGTTDSGSGANKKIGRSVAAAGDNDATVRVRLSQ